LLGKNQIKGASHLYAGEEAVAVGAISNLRDDDLITSAHRGHGHCHARGASMAKDEKQRTEHYNKMMAELCGRSTGYCLGRGGSMHIADVEKGNLGATGIVGGNIPVATGAGLARQMQGKDSVVLCFFGDGASNTGNFHESLNMAALWKLPVVYIVENNLYGMSVPLEKATAKLNIADRACAYGIPGQVVDGMDVLAVRQAVGEAVERARQGAGPSLVECQTYRWYGHSRSDPRVYRTKDEEAEWKARDPLPAFAARLVEAGVATQTEIDALQKKVERPLGRGGAGGISVVADHDPPGVPGEQAPLVRGECGPERGDRVLEPGLPQRGQVEVALDHDRISLSADRILGLVEPVQVVPFDVRRSFRRVQVFRLGVSQGAPAERDGPPGAVPDREHQAVPEAVVLPLRLLSGDRQSAADHLLRLEPPGQEVRPERLPGVRRVAQAEAGGGLDGNPAAPEVLPG